MKQRVIFWIGLSLFALFVAAMSPLALLTGCSKQSDGPSATVRVLTAEEIRAPLGFAFCGDTAFAEVNSASLPAFYADFRQALFDQGVTKWDRRFDCNHFASYYVARAQTKFYLANFHSRTTAQTLALGVFWYQSARGPHAIVAAFTERGLLFIEPQTGGELQLSPAERASAWLKLF